MNAMRKDFHKELIKSGWLHRPLPVKWEDSMDAERKSRKVTARKKLWPKDEGESFVCTAQGECRIGFCTWYENGVPKEGECLEMEGELRQDFWPEGMPQDGDCAYYGNLSVVLPLEGEDWLGYNRLRFQVRPFCRGLHTISLSAWVKNEGAEKVPDAFGRTGQHMMNLENDVWNDCIWEFSSMARECISQLEFRYRLSGSDTGFGEKAVFQIRDICLEKTEEEKYQGWEPEKGSICLDSCGYFPGEQKRAVTDRTKGGFLVVKADTEEAVLEGEIETEEFLGSSYGILDFSKLQETGNYRLRIKREKEGIGAGTEEEKPGSGGHEIKGGKRENDDYAMEGEGMKDGGHEWKEAETQEFQIGNDWAEEMLWKGMNFLFCQRCGHPVPGKHGRCHTDCYGIHGEERVSYAGGWHDAGDMSQQTVQSAEITETLFLTAMRHKDDTAFYERCMEEACWGLSFLLGTRFGDGYRATSLGLIRWTDLKEGNHDDASNVRVFNHGIDNLICACGEAVAAKALREYDRESGWAALEAAKEDYGFGLGRFLEYGFEVPVMWEHTYGSSSSLCYAVISKCAGLLYEMTGEEKYREDVCRWTTKLLECQETGGQLGGYFYRDETKGHIVHFNHQAREGYFADSLIGACRLCGSEEKRGEFLEGLERYGDYFEALIEHASPYGMMPAGVYAKREAEQEEVFRRMHLLSDYAACKADYVEQVKKGKKVGADLYLRQFPVWFSFRGNTNVQLSMAQAALRVGKYLNRPSLVQAAAEQIHWLNGKNPFRQSLVTGNGKRYDFFYAVFPGTCAGQIPVGIQTKKNEDFPYWTAGNQATHREVWTTCTIKMMDICAELLDY